MASEIAEQVNAQEKTSLLRILEEAEKQFSERGFDGVSVNEVANAAGVCKANVFHHFASKQELYDRVLARSCEAFAGELDGWQLQGRSLAERLAQIVESHEAFLRRRPHGTRLILRELSAGRLDGSPVFPLLQRNFERVVGMLAEVADELRDGIAPAQVARLVLSLNLFGFQSEKLDERRVALGALPSRDEARRQLIDLILHGVLQR